MVSLAAWWLSHYIALAQVIVAVRNAKDTFSTGEHPEKGGKGCARWCGAHKIFEFATTLRFGKKQSEILVKIY